MKLEVSEVYSVSGLQGSFETLAAAMAAIDTAEKPGSYTITHAMKVVASGAGIAPGKAVTGQPVKPAPK